jgi:drug/metabolite transporter (DMT)-like permease
VSHLPSVGYNPAVVGSLENEYSGLAVEAVGPASSQAGGVIALTYVGGISALGTAFCWAGSSLSFTAAGKRIGSVPLNLIRLVMAMAMLSVFMWILRGRLLPTDATAQNWFWLGLSGLAGFTFGDLFLFRALVLLEARLAMLVMTLAPPMVALIAWAVIGEALSPWSWMGIAMTVAGVAWVVTEKHHESSDSVVAQRGIIVPRDRHVRPRVSALGLAFAFLGAFGQAVGLVLSKIGLGSHDAGAATLTRIISDAGAGTQIRIIAGIGGFVVIFTAAGWWPRVAGAMRHPSGMGLAMLGSAVGPFVGVTLSLVAVRDDQTGVAATLMAISPIILIPASAIIHKERITWRAVSGAVLAVGGVAMLFLHP